MKCVVEPPTLQVARTEYEALVERAFVSAARGDDEIVLASVERVGRLAAMVHAGRLEDGRLEGLALEIGRRLPVTSLPAKRTGIAQRSILHVATAVFPYGGHTRFMANWIRNDPSSCHSVALLNQAKRAVPHWLSEAVESSGGDVFHGPAAGGYVERAMWLRSIARDPYRVIVLHHHSYDVTPIVSFALGGGPPVAAVNHTDQAFWVGASVADAIISFRESGRQLSTRRRHARDNLLLPTPLHRADLGLARAEARVRLRIAPDRLILTTSGAPFKYTPIDGADFFATAARILERWPLALLFAVGSSAPPPGSRAPTAATSRIRFVGTTPDPVPYSAAADVYLDGFPFSSFTATLEAAALKVAPVLAPGTGESILSFDDVALNPILPRPRSEAEYCDLVDELLSNPGTRDSLASRASEAALEHHTGPTWQKYVEACYGRLERERHQPRSIPESPPESTVDDLRLHAIGVARNDPGEVGAYFRRLHDLDDLIRDNVPEGSFVLIDQDELRSELAFGARSLPLTEKDGQYWGLPRDSEAAIDQLEAARVAGATAVVITWPAFWWLDYYAGFERYLRERYQVQATTGEATVFVLKES